ncbi:MULTISPECIES: hypothetical protein [unclassified Frankia]|uniref:hypothetical protein n=1 Tax=unclassified Frankia TaxID=2632575 RepID=UPI002AD47F55|nr:MULTISPECIES: hypothetical protein [unclassified Frankia]
MLSHDEVLAITDPVERAVVANDLIWTNCDRRTSLRTVRSQALREAVESGRTSQEIAERLRVTENDLTWMTNGTVSTPRVSVRAT